LWAFYLKIDIVLKFWRAVLICFVVSLPALVARGQSVNQWINFSQQYIKVKTAKDGIYKITFQDLENAGVAVAGIDPRLIQLYHRGKEQSIFIQGQSDAVFNTDDYIEFFGRANDGTLDKTLYKPQAAQPHNYYNLFSDTTAYFLTWSNSAVPGKRVTSFSEINVTNIDKEVFHTEQRLMVNATQYSAGFTQSDVLRHTYFDVGEGWTGNAISQGQSLDYTLDLIQNTESGSRDPQLQLLLVGRDRSSHTAQIFVGPGTNSLREAATQNINEFESVVVTIPLMWSDISVDGRVHIRLVSPPAANNRPQFSVSYLDVTFPQNFQSISLIEKVFNLQSNTDGKSYVEWDNAPITMRVWDVTDPTAIISIGTRVSGNQLTAVIPGTETPRTLYAFTLTHTPAIQKVKFRLIDPAQAEYLVISNSLLMKPALAYANPVTAYAGYRASAVGGGYDTLVVTMDQLYNQFNYGETSATAIYEFMRFMTANGNPKYLFLIGKGRDVSAGFHRMNNPAATISKDLVPSAGMPGSDMNFTVGLKGTTFEAAVPTGRLSVTTPNEVANYLDKIKEIENPLADNNWQKQGLHLSGGIQDFELPAFKSYVDGFKVTAEGQYWGGAVNTIAKRDPSPVTLVNISDEINEGVNLVTFFGHSSPTLIEIDIGFVTDPVLGYNNPGKYPVFLINGCNAGSFFLNNELFGENWINTANRGARNFIAHSSFGFVSTLRYYSDLFYRVGFADSVFIKKGVGDVQKEVARQYMQAAPATMANITQVQQMMLLGDPAVRLFNYDQPDYEITNSSLSLESFDNKPVTASSDSFAVKIIVKNLGLAKIDPITIRLIRTRENGAEVSYDSLFSPVFNVDTLTFIQYREGSSDGGNNQFTIILDPENKIAELKEDNNEATFNIFIPSNATLNLFPAAYAIVNQSTAKLVWQSTNLLSAPREFLVEIDTTDLFNSPFLINLTIAGKVIASTEVNLVQSDSVVYFWRTRFKTPQPGESNEWTTSTFSFIDGGPEGWAQISSQQIKENFFSNLVPTEEGILFNFEESVTALSITTFGSDSPLPFTDVSVKINNAEYNLATQFQPCRNNTLNLIAFNKTTAIPYAGLPFNFQDPRACGRVPQLINSFLLSELETGLNDDLAAFIDAVGVSDSVVLFSIGNPGYTSWPATVKSLLGELGIELSELEALQPGEPVIIFGRKGAAPGTATITRSLLTPVSEQLITVNASITGRKSEGFMKSVTIGPAAEWKQFISKATPLESEDQITFSIYGIRLDGVEDFLTDVVANTHDLSTISVEDYPYLKVNFHTRDEINLTPAQWNNWAVLFEPAAEGILILTGTETSVTVQEGQAWSTRFGFTNISSKNFSGLLQTDVEIFTKESQLREQQSFVIDPPAPGDTTFFEVTASTIGKTGKNDVNVFVNKRVLAEPYYDNNFMSLPDYLNVLADKTPPTLDVTFDNRTLRNGDFTAPTPVIRLLMNDENPFRLKLDTVGVTLLLSYPCDNAPCLFKRIALSGSDVKWYAATESSDFRIEFTPQLADGGYVLSAQVADATGNLSGLVPYEISFNVKSEPTLEFLSVYPNPSNEAFFFSFVLTGNQLPEEFNLEIFTSQGQRLRTFTIDDVEQFTIGTNELMWDGRDAQGGFLPRGFYVYRLQLSAGDIKKSHQGKLVLMR